MERRRAAQFSGVIRCDAMQCDATRRDATRRIASRRSPTAIATRDVRKIRISLYTARRHCTVSRFPIAFRMQVRAEAFHVAVVTAIVVARDLSYFFLPFPLILIPRDPERRISRMNREPEKERERGRKKETNRKERRERERKSVDKVEGGGGRERERERERTYSCSV